MTALVGFFYQLLGSASVLITAQNQATSNATTLLYLEQTGEDALLSNSTKHELIQFKYSTVKRPIEPEELAGILKRLDAHSQQGWRWRLVTNRALSSGAAACLPGRKGTSSLLANVKIANRNAIATLGGKLNIDLATFAHLEARLHAAGRSFGLTPSEIAAGAKELIGDMMTRLRDHGGGTPISRADLDTALTRIKLPGRLDAAARAAAIIAELDGLASDLEGPLLENVTPRTALADLCVNDDPVTVVIGPGGCGKTVSVLRALRDYVEARRSLACALLPQDPSTVATLVAAWRSPSVTLAPESLPISLQRLAIANESGSVWLLVLAVDGLDEQGWRAERLAHVRDIIQAARKSAALASPSAKRLKVIMTCRSMRDVEFLLGGTGVGGERSETPEPTELGDFDEAEFRATWSKWFGHLPAPRRSDASVSTESLADVSRPITALDAKVADALHHPTILGCFSDLAHNERLALLEGDQSMWTVLLRKYLTWFMHKVDVRQGKSFQPQAMLCAVARATATDFVAQYDHQSKWINPIVAETGRPHHDARTLFEEAVTSGLIVTQEGLRVPQTRPVSWRWRYEFVPEYLCTLP